MIKEIKFRGKKGKTALEQLNEWNDNSKKTKIISVVREAWDLINVFYTERK